MLETAGQMWAAARVFGRYAISNCLTIGESLRREPTRSWWRPPAAAAG